MSPFTNTPFAMPTPSIALLFSLAFALSNALPWSGPQETGVYRADEFSPRPTGSPDYEGQIFKRDSVAVNVCGWVGGRPENVARCGSGSSCVHDTIHRFIGCCATAGPCTDGVFTTCIDQGNAEWKAEGGLINNGVLSCRSSSTCYQNTFPGDYKQYTCGDSSQGGEVQTTYDGQPKDMRLQIVYTGVNFAPISRPPIPTVPFNAQATGAAAGNGAAEAPDSTTTDKDKEETTGYIAGGTIGGVAVAAILIAGLVLFLRRRRRASHRVGGFVGLQHRPEPPPAAGPLKRLTKLYSPSEFGPLPRRSTAQDDAYMSPRGQSSRDGYLDPITEGNDTTYISPLTGHPDESHQQSQMRQQYSNTPESNLLGLNSASTYNGAFPGEMDAYNDGAGGLVPISRLNINRNNSGPNSQSHSPQLLPSDEEARQQQRQPLVGIQIDDFGSSSNTPALQSRNWSQGYANLNSADNQNADERGTHIHSGGVMQESQDLGLLGNVRRAASQMVHGNSRTQDKNVRSESMRQSNPFSDIHETRDDDIWKSTPMNAPKLKEPDGFGLGLGFGSNTWGSLMSGGGGAAASSSSSSQPHSQPQTQHPQIEKQKLERPIMEQMMEHFNAAARGVGAGNHQGSSTAIPSTILAAERPTSPTISSASAASRYGGMYAVPEEGGPENDGEEEGSSVSSLGGTKPSARDGAGGIRRGASSAGLLRKPVGGTVLGHRSSRSDA